jgi:[CysO sulfur-carrier protein]-S-L-cysteine hydrolase
MRIRRVVLERIVAHARAEVPLECCGLLIGSADLVEESYAVANVRNSRTRFAVDPAGHFAAIKKARAAGLIVVGAYHSHPESEAVPSETDVHEANDPEFVHLIVSLNGPRPEAKAYRIGNGAVEPLLMEVE